MVLQHCGCNTQDEVITVHPITRNVKNNTVKYKIYTSVHKKYSSCKNSDSKGIYIKGVCSSLVSGPYGPGELLVSVVVWDLIELKHHPEGNESNK